MLEFANKMIVSVQINKIVYLVICIIVNIANLKVYVLNVQRQMIIFEYAKMKVKIV